DGTAATLQKMYRIVPDRFETDPVGYALDFPNGESWSFGDSVAIGLLLGHHVGDYQEVAAPVAGPDGRYEIPADAKSIRWYQTINQRFILEDFFAKMNYYYGRG
ncbi:MAG: hypothetical protein IJ751_10645, partial [Oscillospiraceae bacterium]|nr:hypothetical protein [Oscillospiraceae bacterium]